MGRPKSVILTPAETKAEIKANNAQAKELQAAIKANEKYRSDATKEYDRAVKAAEKARDGSVKAVEREIKRLTKELDAINAKTAKLQGPKETATA